jgi:hypothetical protein
MQGGKKATAQQTWNTCDRCANPTQNRGGTSCKNHLQQDYVARNRRLVNINNAASKDRKRKPVLTCKCCGAKQIHWRPELVITERRENNGTENEKV